MGFSEGDAKYIQDGLAFAVSFAYALIKLKNAKVSGTGVTLTAEEVKAVIEGFQLLRKNNPQ